MSGMLLLSSFESASKDLTEALEVPGAGLVCSGDLFKRHVNDRLTVKMMMMATESSFKLANKEHSKSWFANTLDAVQLENDSNSESRSLDGSRYSGSKFEDVSRPSNTCSADRRVAPSSNDKYSRCTKVRSRSIIVL